MKIKINEKDNRVPVSSLKGGEVFYIDNCHKTFFLALDYHKKEGDKEYMHAADLDNGEVLLFELDFLVYPANDAQVVIGVSEEEGTEN